MWYAKWNAGRVAFASYIVSVRSAFCTGGAGSTNAGVSRAGISPKYVLTSCIASSGLKSPLMLSTALFGA